MFLLDPAVIAALTFKLADEPFGGDGPAIVYEGLGPYFEILNIIELVDTTEGDYVYAVEFSCTLQVDGISGRGVFVRNGSALLLDRFDEDGAGWDLTHVSLPEVFVLPRDIISSATTREQLLNATNAFYPSRPTTARAQGNGVQVSRVQVVQTCEPHAMSTAEVVEHVSSMLGDVDIEVIGVGQLTDPELASMLQDSSTAVAFAVPVGQQNERG